MTQTSGSTPTRARSAPRDFLKQIVYGGNDGIVTTFAIVAGFAGANAQGAAQIGAVAVLVFGFANLFADAVSMGLGEFLSGRSRHGLYRARKRAQMNLIATHGSTAVDPLVPYFADANVRPDDLDSLKSILARNPDLTSDLIMARVYGMEPPNGGDLVVGAWATFFSFVVFGIIPLLPYLVPFTSGSELTLSIIATFVALVLLGLLRWLATGERVEKCVGEAVLIGGICAIVAYLVGALIG